MLQYSSLPVCLKKYFYRTVKLGFILFNFHRTFCPENTSLVKIGQICLGFYLKTSVGFNVVGDENSPRKYLHAMLNIFISLTVTYTQKALPPFH